MGAAAFGAGLLLAVAASGGIAGERVTRGAFSVDMVASVSATLAAILAAVTTMRCMLVPHDPPEAGDAERRPLRSRALALLLPQALGAVVGIVLVHALLRREALGVLPWLSEKPAQLVNDAVDVFGLLALVWAYAKGLDARILVFALLGVTLYRLTSRMWHLDHAADGFIFTVQELVVAQLVAAAIGLGIFRLALDEG